MKHDLQAQYVARRCDYDKGQHIDISQSTKQTTVWFDNQWDVLTTRLKIVPGKKVLRLYRDVVQEQLGVSISNGAIVDAFGRADIEEDLKQLLARLRAFSVP